MNQAQFQAEDLFKQGYNCAQSVILSLAPSLRIDPQVAKSIASGFGGGMGAQSTCGAVSAAYMIMGLYVGSKVYLLEPERKNELSNLMTAYNKAFTTRFGSLNCRVLTGVDFTLLDKEADKDTFAQIHQTCNEYVTGSVAILEELLKNR